MRIMDKIYTDADLKQKWERILGADILEQILNAPEMLDSFTHEKRILKNDQWDEFLSFSVPLDTSSIFSCNFPQFYHRISAYTNYKLTLSAEEFLTSSIIQSLAQLITKQMSWLSIRCLIQEMQTLKSEGYLRGSDTTKEYEYFLYHYLCSHDYQNAIFEKYAVMTELLVSGIDENVNYIREVLTHLSNDRAAVIDDLCEGHKFQSVINIQPFFSDAHCPGKTVARLILDNGYTIYHKPHSLRPALTYDVMHRWLLLKCGMDCFEYKILDMGSYGWEREVSYDECEAVEDIVQFYYRIGLQLCLVYILKISDIHFENIIAAKKYPVLIDLEVFPDGHNEPNISQEKNQDYFRDTVRNSGMLPVKWGSENFINMGGLGESGSQKGPYLMPVIIHAGTSDMQIGYAYPKIERAQNIPGFKGHLYDYRSGASQIVQGFETAYKCVMENKADFLKCLKENTPVVGRYVLRNTQEYAMFRNLICYPDFLRHKDERHLILFRMNKGLTCESSYRKELLCYEMDCLDRLVVPIYYAYGNDLLTGNGHVLKKYFSYDVSKQLEQRVIGLNRKDMEFQKQIIISAFLPYLPSDGCGVM